MRSHRSSLARDGIKDTLQVHDEQLSDRYLGMPTEVGHAKNGTFKYLRDRVWEKIKGLMEKLLSYTGKEVLIKAVARLYPYILCRVSGFLGAFVEVLHPDQAVLVGK